METSTIEGRATGRHNLLKCTVLTAMDIFSLTSRPWRPSGGIAVALDLHHWGVPRARRVSMLQFLGKASGRYAISRRGVKAPWPPSWRLLDWRESKNEARDEFFEYKITSHGSRWLRRSRAFTEWRCGLTTGDVAGEVTHRLGVSVYFRHARRNRAYAITAPFHIPGGSVLALVPVKGVYRLPETAWCSIEAAGALAAVHLIERRLGIPLCGELRKTVVDADIGVTWR